MTTWIGHPGRMVETPCLSDLTIDGTDTAVHGGGPGTLAPARVLILTGPGPRVLQARDSVARPWQAQALDGLYRAQHVVGHTPYRVVPCGAATTNLLAPGEADFQGWSRTLPAGGPATVTDPVSELVRVVDPGTLITSDTTISADFVIHGRYWRDEVRVTEVATVVPATVILAPSTSTTTPPLPVTAPGVPVVAAFDVRGTVTVTLTWLDATGATISTDTAPVGQAVFRRAAVTRTPPDGAVSVTVRVATGTVTTAYLARAQVAQSPTGIPPRVAPGAGIAQAWLSPIRRDILHAHPGNHIEALSYEVTEVGT